MPPAFAGSQFATTATHSLRCGLEEYRQLRWLTSKHNLRFVNSLQRCFQNIAENVYVLEIYKTWECHPDPSRLRVNAHDQRMNRIILQVGGEFRSRKLPAFFRARTDGQQQRRAHAALFAYNLKEMLNPANKPPSQLS